MLLYVPVLCSFSLLYNIPLCGYITVCPVIGRHWGCFQLGAITISAAGSVLVHRA